jgi:hypothetical protein
MKRAQHSEVQNQMQILRRSLGPTNCLYMTQGLNEKLNLPTGGGRKGETLGWSRAAPTLFFSAYAFGQMSICSLAWPLHSVTFVCWFLL